MSVTWQPLAIEAAHRASRKTRASSAAYRGPGRSRSAGVPRAGRCRRPGPAASTSPSSSSASATPRISYSRKIVGLACPRYRAGGYKITVAGYTMKTAERQFTTISGVPDRAGLRAGICGGFDPRATWLRPASFLTRAASTATCTAASSGPCASSRASPRRRKPTAATTTCWSRGRPAFRWPSICPP